MDTDANAAQPEIKSLPTDANEAQPEITSLSTDINESCKAEMTSESGEVMNENNPSDTSDMEETCLFGASTIEVNDFFNSDSVIATFESQLKAKDQLLHKAGQFGQSLLEQNAELQNLIDIRDKEFQDKLEKTRQEIHSLHKSLEQKLSMERIYLEEIDSLKTALENTKQQQEFETETGQMSKISEMKKKNESLQMEVDKLVLSEIHLAANAESLTAEITILKRDLATQEQRSNVTCSEEMVRLLSEVQVEKEVNDELKKSAQIVNQQCDQLLMKEGHLKQEMMSSREEVEEKECQITSYQNALEKSREEVQDLQVQLDVQRMESMHKASKGNSLFSEVEDRRVKAELELAKVRSQYEGVKKKHTMVAQQMHRYQSQMLVFMQSASNQIDETRLRKLERESTVARQQIQILTRENTELKQSKSSDIDIRVIEGITVGTKANFESYMKIRLENKIAQLQTELSREKFQRMGFETSLMEKESKLYNCEKQVKKTEATAAKLRLDIEKLKLKYEPESLNVGDKIKKRFVEVIPLDEITDICPNRQTNNARSHRRNDVLSMDSLKSKKKVLNLSEILSAPKSAKRVKINEEVVVLNDAVAVETNVENSVAMETKDDNTQSKEENVNSVTKPETVEEKKEVKRGKGREQYCRNVRVTGENPEQCKQQ